MQIIICLRGSLKWAVSVEFCDKQCHEIRPRSSHKGHGFCCPALGLGAHSQVSHRLYNCPLKDEIPGRPDNKCMLQSLVLIKAHFKIPLCTQRTILYVNENPSCRQKLPHVEIANTIKHNNGKFFSLMLLYCHPFLKPQLRFFNLLYGMRSYSGKNNLIDWGYGGSSCTNLRASLRMFARLCRHVCVIYVNTLNTLNWDCI